MGTNRIMAKTMAFNTLGVKWRHTAYVPHSLCIFKAFDAVITASYIKLVAVLTSLLMYLIESNYQRKNENKLPVQSHFDLLGDDGRHGLHGSPAADC